MKLLLVGTLGLLGACATCPPVATPTCPAAPAGAEPAAAAPSAGEEVRAAEAAARRTSPSGKSLITLLARGQNAFIGKLEMLPGAAVPQHQDPTEEYIHVLSGHGTMTMNGKSYDIGPGTTIFMPAFATVSYQNGDEPLVAIQVFAGPSPADKYETWK
jgi:quercetin dioxygenase-like cupin family protein